MHDVEQREETARADRHRERLMPYLGPHLARREAGVKHPVHDFLFTYYSFRPAQLLRWSPGASWTTMSSPTECAGQKP